MNFYLNLVYDPVLKKLDFMPNRELGTSTLERRDIVRLISSLQNAVKDYDEHLKRLQTAEGLEQLIMMERDDYERLPLDAVQRFIANECGTLIAHNK